MKSKLSSLIILGCLFIFAFCETSFAQQNSNLQSSIDSFVADMNRGGPTAITDGLTLFNVSVNHKDKLLVYDYRCYLSFKDLSSSEKNEFRQLLSTLASGSASNAFTSLHSNKKFDYTQRYRFYSNFNELISSFDVSYSSYSKAQKAQNNTIDGKIKQFIDEHPGNHIKFSGIPVTGRVYDYWRKLPFSFNGGSNGSVRLKGEYIGKQCNVYLSYTPISNTVYSVSIVFKRESDWRKVKNDYLSLKKSLTQKYGSPIESKEEFHTPYKEGDGREFNALKDGKATWRTKYKVDDGEILVGIISQSDSFSEMTVCLTYVDSINEGLNRKEKSDSL